MLLIQYFMDMSNLKYSNVAISGRIATGTSTLAKSLAQTLGWKRINVGDLQREFDRKRGMDEKITGSDTRTDAREQEMEDMTKEKLTKESQLVYEAWLAGFVARGIPGVLKVLLVCDDALRIDRMVNRDNVSVEDAKRQIRDREQGNIKKWKRLYGDYDFWDPKEFDLVIDTYASGPYETLGKVLDALGFNQKAINGKNS
jgi:cytidylate kinase